MSKQYANLHTMAKTSVKFQNDWPKTVGGVALTSQLLTNCRTDKRTNVRVTARLYRTCMLMQVRQKQFFSRWCGGSSMSDFFFFVLRLYIRRYFQLLTKSSHSSYSYRNRSSFLRKREVGRVDIRNVRFFFFFFFFFFLPR